MSKLFSGSGTFVLFVTRVAAPAAYHVCPEHCGVCLDPSCSHHVGQLTKCDDCNSTTLYCLKKHKEKQWRPRVRKYASQCDMHKQYPDCKMSYNNALSGPVETHRCDAIFCRICEKKYNG